MSKEERPKSADPHNNGAEFSKCRNYRYALWRIWDEAKPPVMFIGLNPSTANEATNDPTIRRVIHFAKAWGHGGVYMLNCFPFVSTDPKQLLTHGNTDFNDMVLLSVAKKCSRIVFAWGAFSVVRELGRDTELKGMFPQAQALVINADGTPRHPLYVKGDTVPVTFSSVAYNGSAVGVVARRPCVLGELRPPPVRGCCG